MVTDPAAPTISIVLERTGKDPAIASGVLLTVIGIFSFLGLAAWLLL